MIPKNKITKHFVTGGAGFIGSHLVDRLIKEGSQVVVYDNLVSGRKQNIKHHFDKDGFRFIEADLLDYDTLKLEMKGHDFIWHLGANTNLYSGNRITDLDLKNSTVATHNLLEAMRQNGIYNLLFASSFGVYGDVPTVALNETFGPLLPISLYGAGKLACEGLISAYSHLFGIKAWIFRFANVVGPKMRQGVIWDFIHKLKQNSKELEILGDGNQERTFLLVEDCIDGMLYAFHNADSQCDVYNLGCESFTPITKVGQIVTEEMGLRDVKLKYTGGRYGRPGDTPIVHLDVGNMKRLGWEARYGSNDAVRITARSLIQETA